MTSCLFIRLRRGPLARRERGAKSGYLNKLFPSVWGNASPLTRCRGVYKIYLRNRFQRGHHESLVAPRQSDNAPHQFNRTVEVNLCLFIYLFIYPRKRPFTRREWEATIMLSDELFPLVAGKCINIHLLSRSLHDSPSRSHSQGRPPRITRCAPSVR